MTPAIVRARAALAGLAACAACGGGVDQDKARALFTRVPVDTRPGLSGLAADTTGGIWTVAERDREAYRITLDAALHPTIERYPVEGVPAATDLEALAVLGGDRFAFGTEGHVDGLATVLVAERKDATIVVTGQIVLPAGTLGLVLKANQGAEGVCGAGDTIIAAIEGAGAHDGRRWAPIARIEAGRVVRTHKLWLTTTTGKISGLDCRIAADGTVTGWAIERHFEVTKLLRFTLPPVGQGADGITPEEALDLGAILNSKLNLEGIAETSDGRVVTVVDNQWKAIMGPSELLVLKPGAVSAR